MKIDRRRFLQGVGGVLVGLPFLSRFGAGEAWADGHHLPRRIIVVAYPMGLAMDHWRPDRAGPDFTLPHITAPLERFKDRCLFVSGCDNAVLRLNEQHVWGHPAKKESALTGTLMSTAFGGDGSNRVENVISSADGAEEGLANNASVCHFIGSRLRRPDHLMLSLDLGVNGAPQREVNDTPSSFFFEGPNNPVTLQCNPARAFNAVFGSLNLDPAAEAAMRQLRQRNKSVLDAVRGSFTELRQGLSVADRRTLDDHAALIREIEVEMAQITCTEPGDIPGAGTVGPSWDPFRSMTMADLAPMQTRILAHAMACDLAPVARIEFIAQQGPRFGVPAVDDFQAAWRAVDETKDWHAMVHGDPSPIDGVPTRPNDQYPDQYAPQLLDGYRFFVEQFANLLQALDDVPEGPDGESVLDHSLVLLVSDYGNGNGHSSNKLGWVMAGNTGPARLGYHFDCAPDRGFYADSDYHTNQLLTSVIQMFGLRDGNGDLINSFGLEGFSQGPIPGLFA